MAAAQDALPPLPSRADLEELAADLPGLWHAYTTSNKDRKGQLRTLIADATSVMKKMYRRLRNRAPPLIRPSIAEIRRVLTRIFMAAADVIRSWWPSSLFRLAHEPRALISHY